MAKSRYLFKNITFLNIVLMECVGNNLMTAVRRKNNISRLDPKTKLRVYELGYGVAFAIRQGELL